MTKYQWPNPEAARHKLRLMGSSKAFYDDVREFMEGLERKVCWPTLARKAGPN